MKNSEIATKLKEHFAGQSVIMTKQIQQYLSASFPNLTSSTIAWKINQLKKENLIQQIGRGMYSFDFKPEYQPDISLKTKRVYNRLKPLCDTDLTVWDTLMLDGIMNKEGDKHWMFFSTTKEQLEPLFDQLLDFSKKVFLSPDKGVINRYMMPLDEAIILTPLVSETPVIKAGDFIVPTIEGILVNAWFQKEAFIKPIGYNIQDLFRHAFQQYNVNRSKLLRFATRRDKRNEIESLIKNIA